MNIIVKSALLLSVSLLFFSCGGDESMQVEKAEMSEMKYGVELNKYFSEIGEIDYGDFFSTLLTKLGATNEQILKMMELSDTIFDVRKIKVGQAFEALYEKVPDNSNSEGIESKDKSYKKGSLAYFIYEKDITTHVVFSLKDSMYVKVLEKEIEQQEKYVEVKINNSLWSDVKSAGVSPVLALKLADIYAWTIDFFGLRDGDSFKVLYNELSYEDEVIDIDEIKYVEFTHNGKVYTAVRFKDGKKGNLYWNERGESLKKAFLKAPLNYVRISSRFSYARRHPVLKIVRPHTGVDYAAPKGTPVMSIGDGVVTQRGWSGGGGNTIKIKHNRTFTTSYMHLSGYAKGLTKGKRVGQGEIIGYVGSTGLATGPHLDFRVYKDGKPIDPLKIISPASEPIAKGSMAAFEETIRAYRYAADSLMTDKYVDKILDNLKVE